MHGDEPGTTLPDCPARVRPATAGDIAAVQAVARASWHDAYQTMLSGRAIDQFLARAYNEYSLRQTLNGGGLFVLERDDEIIGYMRLGRSDRQGYLGAIYLLPEVQGQGFGRLLWERALEWFRGGGLNEVILTVARDNWRARAFYKKLGFVETAETESQIAGEPLMEITCHARLRG